MGVYCNKCQQDSVERKGEYYVCSNCGAEYTKSEIKEIFSKHMSDMIDNLERDVIKLAKNQKANIGKNSAKVLRDDIESLCKQGKYSETIKKCDEFFVLKDNSDYPVYYQEVELMCSKSYLAIAGCELNTEYLNLSIEHFENIFKKADQQVSTDLSDNALINIRAMIMAIIGVECRCFKKEPSDANCNRMYEAINLTKNYIDAFNAKMVKYGVTIDKSLEKSIADKLNSCALDASDNIHKLIVKYGKAASYNSKISFINSIVNCCTVEKYAMLFDDNILYSKNYVLILKDVQTVRLFMVDREVLSTNQLVKDLDEQMKKYGEKVKAVEPDFKIPYIHVWNRGCYVATAVYGSYDCPQVWTLRRYRDNTLAKTWYGRAFIHTYYAISPTLVKWFGKTKWFRKLWKGKLDKMVARLQAQGVESTPYNDKEW